MIKLMRRAKISSDMLYMAGAASIAASVAAWALSLSTGRTGLGRADRWGIFVGEWAPTFFALGVAMRIEEECGEEQEAEKVERLRHRAEDTMPVG